METHRPFAFTNWMAGQPDVSEQKCVEIRGISNSKWHDENCYHQHLLICICVFYCVLNCIHLRHVTLPDLKLILDAMIFPIDLCVGVAIHREK